jgi:hypothetical protein
MIDRVSHLNRFWRAFLCVNSNLRTASTIFLRYLTRRSKAWRGGLRFGRPITCIDALTPFVGQGPSAFWKFRRVLIALRNSLIKHRNNDSHNVSYGTNEDGIPGSNFAKS